MDSIHPIRNNSLQAIQKVHPEMRFSIHIVDDEHSGRTALKILLEKCFWANIESLSFSYTFEEAKEKLQSNKYDILFLDINLKGISAFELMTFIPNATKVVFVTAYSEFMLKALRNKAFDYLVKPIKEDDLIQCLSRLHKELILGTNERCLLIKHRGITILCKHSEIVYFAGDGPYSTIFMVNETITTARTLKSLEPELGVGFIRIHKSYLVNKACIKGFNKDKLILQNEQSLPVSRTGLKKLNFFLE